MPWSTLELDPATATERDVKRAYAKRLKTCRPDQDPEGFRKLHDAYTLALTQVQWRDSEDEEELVAAEGSAAVEGAAEPEPPEPILPEASSMGISPGQAAVTSAHHKLELALRERHEDVEGLVREYERVLYEHPDEVSPWGQLMHLLIRNHAAHPDLRLKPEVMIFELEHGGSATTLGVIERLDMEGNRQGLVSLARLFLDHKSRIAGPGGGLAAARLAQAAAFWDTRYASALADYAYQNLARGERDYHMQMIDRNRVMGDQLTLVPEDLLCYWRQRLLGHSGPGDRDDERNRETQRWLLTVEGRNGPHFETLLSFLPEELATEVRRKVPPPKKMPDWESERAGRRPKVRELDTRGASVPVWIYVTLTIMVIKLIATCSNSSASSSRDDSRYEFRPSLGREIPAEEMQRTLEQSSGNLPPKFKDALLKHYKRKDRERQKDDPGSTGTNPLLDTFEKMEKK